MKIKKNQIKKKFNKKEVKIINFESNNFIMDYFELIILLEQIKLSRIKFFFFLYFYLYL